ncbi:MAG: thiamine phosphate synthase [Rhodocyclaceae bacterium]|nr:thiamine phosphate synthase [Rhodocyclaceae bacterium]
MHDSDRLLTLCARALEGRPALLQYRSKLEDLDLRQAQATALLALCRAREVPLIINDDVSLAVAIGADGAHVGREDGAVTEARARLGRDSILGVTCYNEFERAVQAVADGADYVAFGAMFPSSTKPAAVSAPVSLVERAVRALPLPVATIGGITLDNAPALVRAGSTLLAVVSDVFDHPDPAGRSARYAELFPVDEQA